VCAAVGGAEGVELAVGADVDHPAGDEVMPLLPAAAVHSGVQVLVVVPEQPVVLVLKA
jgi:hypothetical protein